jgi:hypothetical protein
MTQHAEHQAAAAVAAQGVAGELTAASHQGAIDAAQGDRDAANAAAVAASTAAASAGSDGE